ncbi:MFS transporter [Micrococcaceae bacterium Sec5.7]
MTSFSYATVLKSHGVSPRLAAVFLSAVPIGMLALTMVLTVERWTGSLAAAGTVSALFSLGNACGLGFQGALMGRLGSRIVIGIAGGACAASIAAFVMIGNAGGPVSLIAALALIAGVSIPAVTSAVRAVLPELLDGEDDKTASYALLSVLFQAAVTIGPLIVSACLIFATPDTAGVIAAVVIAAACLLFVRQQPPARPHVKRDEVSSKKPKWPSGLVTVLGTTSAIGVVSGVFIVALPAITTRADAPALSGLLFAFLAIGEVVGAFVYGARTWPWPRREQLGVFLIGATVVFSLAVLASLWPYSLVPAMFLCGMAIAPISIILSTLLDDVVEPGELARAYSLMVAVSLVATAAASALTGALASIASSPMLLLFIVPAAISFSYAWSRWRRDTLLSGAKSPASSSADVLQNELPNASFESGRQDM